jgi:hypothetical protein
MIDTKSDSRRPVAGITGETIRDLVRREGPCITVILPPYRPGEPGKPAATILKTDLQEAAGKLAARKIAKPLIEELLEPLEQLTHQEESLAGSGWARAILRSRGVFREFELPLPPTPAQACAVSDCFWIRPLLQSLALPEKVYVLDLSKKSVALAVCGPKDIAPVELPPGTPRTLDEALNFDAPDHDLVNRSSAGPSSGAMAGVKFGTGAGREAQHAHLHDFYRAVDRGVNHILRGSEAPLVLAGVEEDLAVYRSANTYAHLAETSIPLTGESQPASRIVRQARDAAVFDVERRAGRRLAEQKERFAPARFSTDLETILRAGAEGRISDLYLDDHGTRTGNFEGKIFGGRSNWYNEDLLNVAAVETLLAGGTVHPLPSHAMPDGAPAAAMFRY